MFMILKARSGPLPDEIFTDFAHFLSDTEAACSEGCSGLPIATIL